MTLLPRTPEPELMQEAAQAKAYAAADFSATDQATVDRILELFSEPPGLGMRIADLGCGPGNISYRLAEHCPDASILGIDGAAAMLAIAEQRNQPTPGRGQLHFLLVTLPCTSEFLGPWAHSCGAVVSNSLLHHLHNPQVLWAAVRQLAAPGAALYIKDLRRPDSPPALDALVALHAADAPPVLRRDYRHSLHAAFRVEEVEAQLAEAGLSSLRVAAVADRYLEVWGRLP